MSTEQGVFRTRFAPSPTGYLHTGGARTALYNWLLARQHNGQFILRIEDTDAERSTEESTRAILDGLRWLGFDWDEGPVDEPARFGESHGPFGPYFQSQRRDRYYRAVEQLLAEGRAFYCPATAEEMTGPDGKKLPYSPYRDLSRAEQEQRLSAGVLMPIRFKCPQDTEVCWQDMVRGEVRFHAAEAGDFIIVKSDGQPLYNLAVVVDDHEMQINHVLRGEDHISNTPKQLLLYEALGWSAPRFGHMPLIVGMDRARLSKRHGATKVGSYREMGVLPEALVNFLLLIGWAPKDNKELFSREEMLEYFNPADITKSAGAFNIEKLEHFNGLYIRALEPPEFFERLKPYLPDGWLGHRGEDYARSALVLYQDKVTMLDQIAGHAWYFFRDPAESDYNEKATAKFLTGNEQAALVLGELYRRFAAAEEWTEERLAAVVERFCEETELGKGKVMQPWRVALTGDRISPGFYDLIAVLGRETVLRRAAVWLDRLGVDRAGA